jgi:hypothetical protein
MTDKVVLRLWSRTRSREYLTFPGLLPSAPCLFSIFNFPFSNAPASNPFLFNYLIIYLDKYCPSAVT